MDDLINRQAAIDALKGLPTWWADSGGQYGGAQPPMVALLDPEDAVSAIENLPSAQPERKKGKWIRHDEIKNVYGGICIECSECGEKYVVQHILDEKHCRNCGADMRGEKDG